jgi:cysteinyl-tRNA synthetase
VPVQPTAQLVGLFCSWHKSKKPHFLIAAIHVENKKRKKGNCDFVLWLGSMTVEYA